MANSQTAPKVRSMKRIMGICIITMAMITIVIMAIMNDQNNATQEPLVLCATVISEYGISEDEIGKFVNLCLTSGVDVAKAELDSYQGFIP